MVPFLNRRHERKYLLTGHREQINLISSYFDAGFLYGTSDEEVALVREKFSCMF